MTILWPYPGARWWKFDFHTHTPMSKDTDAWQRAIGTPDELTPEKWLLKYMAAEIDCVAVTDHNSGAWIDKLKSAYTEMKADPPEGFRELHLFPGVEISVNGGFHLLTIFDIEVATGDIDSLLGKVDYDGTKGDSNGVTRRSAADVVQAVLDAGALPIPAHADENNGLLKLQADGSLRSVIDPHTLKQVLDNPSVLAMEVINPQTSKPSLYSQKKLKWAEVIGSDCHSFRGPAVPGSRYTWVKMAHPSLDGLRLALLDGQGVSIRRFPNAEPFNPFNKPEHFIESIEISDAQFMGRDNQPAHLKFNPYFNALIGGRGTGKSTVIHALRLAYRREKELERESEAGETFARFNKVAKNRSDEGGLRANTQIKLIVSRDGIRHRLSWRQDGQGAAVEEWDDSLNDFKPSASQAITGQRFPVRLFSQGQIAALAGESQQALLNVIDEAAATNKAKATFEEAKRGFFATRAKLRELDGKLKEREALNLSLQDIQRKLARFESADHAEILKTYQRTNRQTKELDRQFDSASELVDRLHNMSEDLLAEDVPDGLFDPVEDAEALAIVQRLTQAIGQARTTIKDAANVLANKNSTIKGQLIASPWQTKTNQAKVAYDTLKTDLQAQGVSDPSEYGRLVQERQRLDTEVRRLDALQKQFEELTQQADTQLELVWQARRAISETRENFLQSALAENHFVRISLLRFTSAPGDMEHSLRATLDITDGRFARDIYRSENSVSEGMIAEINTANNKNLIIKDIQRQIIEACCGQGHLGADFRNRLQRLASDKPELMDHILCWFPEDGLEVEYSRKGDGRDFQSIGQASAGQRAAAMLAFLLAHGNEPLVLDQPEDDLDNHLIYDLIVRQIRINKQRRQLVIVTHNPNIVVNGDAEMIYAFDFNHQCHVKKKESGSLQNQDVRDEVCKVMEGGKDAFERRYQRLGRER